LCALCTIVSCRMAATVAACSMRLIDDRRMLCSLLVCAVVVMVGGAAVVCIVSTCLAGWQQNLNLCPLRLHAARGL
jgi:hypothetical protein